jgi:hypothetical protein
VFHLFGRLSAVPAYAVTQEDVLEFTHSLQSETRRPALLIDELNRGSLLVVGSTFAGWLARFFMRAARRERLLRARGRTDFVADTSVREDASLVLFLRHFSSRTKVFEGGAVEFVSQLHARWRERHPAGAAAGSRHEPALAPSTSGQDPGAVFVSYASEDRGAAESITRALEEAGVDVFLDKEELRAGDAWETLLRRRIRDCALFVPIISQHTLVPGRRYFRAEWALAIEEARKAASSESFILPVAIDGTSHDAPQLPEQFAAWQWERVDPVTPSDAFVSRVRNLYRQYQKSRAGAL